MILIKLLFSFPFSLVLFISGFNKSDDDAILIKNNNDNHSYLAKNVPVLPEFRIVNTTGDILNLSQLKGKKVFVNLWASWCPPCRKELPSIEKLYHSADTEKVAFIILSLDRNFETAQRFVIMKRINLPIYSPAEDLPELFNVPGIPVTFIFNEKGELIQETDGGDDYNTQSYKELLNH